MGIASCLLASASSQATATQATLESGTKITKKAVSGARSGASNKLRMEMLKWFCVESSGHDEDRPCKTFSYMQKRLKAKDADEKKKLEEEHKATMPTDEAGKKQLGLQTREGFLKMYNSYCAQTPPPNPAVCSDASLKKVFEKFTSQQSAKDKPAPVSQGVLSDSTTP